MAQPAPGIGTPPAPVRRRRGGCLGCLIPLLVIVALLAAGFYFLVVQAAAAVSVPAQLVVLNPATSLTHGGSKQPAKTGALVHAGDSILNDASGRSLVQFQDGSITRLAPGAQITLQAADFNRDGQLSNVSISQQAGRTMNTVQKLIGGAKFDISGHSAAASVRGTKFEVIQNADGSVRLKTFIGVVHFAGGNAVDVAAGQQADASPGGAVSKPGPITADPADPFTLWMSSEEAAKAAGQPATAVTSFDQGAVATGQTANQPDYDTAGGEVVGTLAYPGSNMQLLITDPGGVVYQAQGGVQSANGRILTVDIPHAPPGKYKVSVKGLTVDPAEHFTVTMVTKFLCAAESVEQAGVVRNILGQEETKQALVNAGGQNVDVRFAGASAGGANLSGSGNFGGANIAAGALVYAAGDGNVAIIITRASFNGLDLKSQIMDAIVRGTGRDLSSLPVGYQVTRVYTCAGKGDVYLVIEGTGTLGG